MFCCVSYWNLVLLNPLSAKKFFVSVFFKICTNIPQDVPINEHTSIFWNKSQLKSYRNFSIFGFFNSAVLSFKNIFDYWKPELSWILICWNFWNISMGSQDMSKTVFILYQWIYKKWWFLTFFCNINPNPPDGGA